MNIIFNEHPTGLSKLNKNMDLFKNDVHFFRIRSH